MKEQRKQGQAAIEYLLLIGVLLAIMLSLAPTLRKQLIGNGRCENPNNRSVFCRLITSLQLDSEDAGGYRYFRLRR